MRFFRVALAGVAGGGLAYLVLWATGASPWSKMWQLASLALALASWIAFIAFAGYTTRRWLPPILMATSGVLVGLLQIVWRYWSPTFTGAPSGAIRIAIVGVPLILVWVAAGLFASAVYMVVRAVEEKRVSSSGHGSHNER